MTTTTKAQEMIDAFEVYDNKGVYDKPKRNEKFLRFLMDRTKVPSFKSTKTIVVGKKKDGTDKLETHKLTLDELTAEQMVELREVSTLMYGRTVNGTSRYVQDEETLADYAAYETFEELRTLILKYPPILQEQMLTIAIMIYLLRHRNADFDSNGAAFGEFYYNFRDIVLGVSY